MRLSFSGKGRSTDRAAPHRLDYFTRDPFLRDDGHDFCLTCTPSDREKIRIETEVHPVGTLSGFPVVEIFYRFRANNDRANNDQANSDQTNNNAKPGPVKWKSILIQAGTDQTGADQYVEIYHVQAYYSRVSLKPAWIAQLGTEQVLATKDSDGGSNGGCFDGYWLFDAGGPTPLDFSAVWSEIEKHIPADAEYKTNCSALHLDKQTIESRVQGSDAECPTCGGLGTVVANFRLEGWRVKPASVEFRPDQQ